MTTAEGHAAFAAAEAQYQEELRSFTDYETRAADTQAAAQRCTDRRAAIFAEWWRTNKPTRTINGRADR